MNGRIDERTGREHFVCACQSSLTERKNRKINAEQNQRKRWQTNQPTLVHTVTTVTSNTKWVKDRIQQKILVSVWLSV